MRDGTAVILAAGYSKRFGEDKRRYELQGTPLLRKTIEVYLQIFSPLTVVIREDDEFGSLIPSECNLVRIPDAHHGMSRTLIAGVKATIDAPWLVIGLSDMPYIKPATLSLIKWVMDQGSYGIVRPRYQNQPGNPIAFSSAFYDTLQNLEGDQGARDFLRQESNRVHHLDVADEGVCIDIDTPVDASR